MSSSAAKRMMIIFAGHSGAYGTHGVPTRASGSLKWEIKSTARTVRGAVTEALWEQHLAGKKPLGVVAIREDSTCVWGSIDIDKYDIELTKIVAAVESAKLPLVPCVSKSGGLHLFLFLSEPQPAADVLHVLRDVAASLGLAGCEIFPKQTQILHDRGDMGNWMVMPYYGDTFGGKLRQQVGLKRTGAEMTISEFMALAEKMRVPPAKLAEMRSTGASAAAGGAKKSKKAKANGAFAPGFVDGPPCLQHMAAGGFPEGGRNNALLMVGIYLKRCAPLDWQSKLEEMNRLYMKPPLSSEEVSSAVRSLEKREYQYTCKTEPMASHCDSMICRTRRYGVGEEGNFPIISGLSKLETDPVIWFVDVEDTRIECSTDDLQDYRRFHKLCMARLNRCYRSMKQDAWYAVVSAAMASVTPVPASFDVGRGGRFLELLEEFCTNRQAGQAKDEILLGRPWLDENLMRHYFRLKDLQRFIEREGVRDMTRPQMTRMIEAQAKNGGLDGGHDFFNLKGKGVNVWWVSADKLHPTPSVDPRPSQEEEHV